MDFNSFITTHSSSFLIISSDDDQPIVQDLYVLIDSSYKLTVSVTNIDYEDDRYNCSTSAIVSPDETRKLAARLNIAPHKLPLLIGDAMKEWREIINPTFNQVQDCFKEITECLLDEGCRLKIKRTHGPHGFICC